jgi:hypothetical protein
MHRPTRISCRSFNECIPIKDLRGHQVKREKYYSGFSTYQQFIFLEIIRLKCCGSLNTRKGIILHLYLQSPERHHSQIATRRSLILFIAFDRGLLVMDCLKNMRTCRSCPNLWLQTRHPFLPDQKEGLPTFAWVNINIDRSRVPLLTKESSSKSLHVERGAREWE